MKFLFLLPWFIVCAPGYIQLWLQFNSPFEWGKKRNVSQSGRKWRNRHWFALPISLTWYLLIYWGSKGYLSA
jgi:hypothetical protein